jgi:hypothetical protein
MSCEQEVRDAVAELNDQIVQWRQIPLGPPIFVPRVDENAMISRWRAAQPAPAAPPPTPAVDPAAPPARAARPRWWRRPARDLTRRAPGR